ncbi:NYN domain-containing protein [Patescibacteria group bacterium]|nr:NYN domain-containing protein [Patescibacteria group bacterium]MBU4481363.1 NYN domain-containing protein [Patescibacteria group bacterium]
MDNKSQKLLESLRAKRIGVFVDDSNLYHAYKKYGWRVDFGKLRKLLENHCDLKFIHYHIAIPDRSDDVFRTTQSFLSKIEPHVILKKKLLKYTPIAGKFMKKADTDVEITLDAVRNIDSLDVIIVMSGDSDFLELKNYVVYDKKKSILFISYEENMAWELRQCWHLYVNRIKNEVVFQ